VNWAIALDHFVGEAAVVFAESGGGGMGRDRTSYIGSAVSINNVTKHSALHPASVSALMLSPPQLLLLLLALFTAAVLMVLKAYYQ